MRTLILLIGSTFLVGYSNLQENKACYSNVLGPGGHTECNINRKTDDHVIEKRQTDKLRKKLQHRGGDRDRNRKYRMSGKPDYPDRLAYSTASDPKYPSYPSYPGYPGFPEYPGYPGYKKKITEKQYASVETDPKYPSYPSYPGYPGFPGYPGYPGYKLLLSNDKQKLLSQSKSQKMKSSRHRMDLLKGGKDGELSEPGFPVVLAYPKGPSNKKELLSNDKLRNIPIVLSYPLNKEFNREELKFGLGKWLIPEIIETWSG